MNIVGAALPNVMFIVGILAIGLGLGIELKVVSLNKEIDKTGRIGAFIIGLVLIGASVVMYLNPSIANRDEAAKPGADAAQVVGAATQPANDVPAATPTQAPAAAKIAPTQAPAAAPAQIAPTQAPAVPAQVAAPGVAVPDLHGLSDKDAQERLQAAGLRSHRVDRCAGPDHGDPKPKKGRVTCQNPPVGQAVASGATVEYVLAGK